MGNKEVHRKIYSTLLEPWPNRLSLLGDRSPAYHVCERSFLIAMALFANTYITPYTGRVVSEPELSRMVSVCNFCGASQTDCSLVESIKGCFQGCLLEANWHVTIKNQSSDEAIFCLFHVFLDGPCQNPEHVSPLAH